MTIRSLSDRERWKLMSRAIHTYRQLLSDTSSGHVFVKHIQALRYLAERENLSVDLFQDSYFKLFTQPKLAISCIFAPVRFFGSMPLPNGHFIGYTATPDYLYIPITTMLSRSRVTASEFGGEIETSLLELKNLLITQSHIVTENSKL